MFTVIWGVNVINFLLKVSWLCWLNRRFCLSKTGQARCFVSPLTHTFVSLRQLLANQPSTEKRPEPAKNSRTNTNKVPVLQFCCTLGSNMFNIFFMFLFCYLLIPQHYYKLNFLSKHASKHLLLCVITHRTSIDEDCISLFRVFGKMITIHLHRRERPRLRCRPHSFGSHKSLYRGIYRPWTEWI